MCECSTGFLHWTSLMTSGCSVRVRVYLPGVSHETTITVIKRAHGARDIPFLRVLPSAKCVKNFGAFHIGNWSYTLR